MPDIHIYAYMAILIRRARILCTDPICTPFPPVFSYTRVVKVYSTALLILHRLPIIAKFPYCWVQLISSTVVEKSRVNLMECKPHRYISVLLLFSINYAVYSTNSFIFLFCHLNSAIAARLYALFWRSLDYNSVRKYWGEGSRYLSSFNNMQTPH